MSDKLKYNKVLAVPILLFEEVAAHEPETGKKISKNLVADNLYYLVSGATYAIPITEKDLKEHWSRSLEGYARAMVSNCASSVYVPSLHLENIIKTSDLENLITPSLKKRILFVDQSNSILTSIKDYFLPISEIAGRHEKLTESLNELSLGLYLFSLASKNHTEVVLSPKNQINAINALKTGIGNINRGRIGIGSSSEALARLSIIEGLFGLYKNENEIPCLRFIAEKKTSIAERIEEILEDAYLLEASKLRTFFSPKANFASIRRDLGKLINFIVKNRKWANGILSAGSALGFSAYTTVPERILDKLPENFQEPLSPVCINPKSHIENLYAGKDSYVVLINPKLFSDISIDYTIYY